MLRLLQTAMKSYCSSELGDDAFHRQMTTQMSGKKPHGIRKISFATRRESIFLDQPTLAIWILEHKSGAQVFFLLYFADWQLTGNTIRDICRCQRKGYAPNEVVSVPRRKYVRIISRGDAFDTRSQNVVQERSNLRE